MPDLMHGTFQMFNIMGFLFPILFALTFVLILSVLIRGWMRSRRDDRSPRLTVEAEVVSKRMEIVHHHYHHGHMAPRSASRYFATFQVASGDRMELAMSGSEYGLLAEGDRGQLTFQGSRYLSFDRMAPSMEEAIY